MENILHSIYYDHKNPASYSTVEKLHKAAIEQDKNITINQVREWWKGELTPTLHKPARRRFGRNPIIVGLIDEQWEADLVDMQEFKNHNGNKKYFLTVIDSLSKFAWAKILRDKSASSIVEAFEEIFNEGRLPFIIRTDRGKEFVNKNFKGLLSKYRIHHTTSHNQEIKCAIVERFNRTLKGRMHKYFTAKGTRKWTDILEDLVNTYNNSFHRTIKMTPLEASESKNDILVKNVYGVDNINELKKVNKTDIKVGDKVRQAYVLKPFDKSYYPMWTDKVSEVQKVASDVKKPMFNINDEKQKFYPEQVQKIVENLYRVEEILKTRNRNGRKEYFVKWLGYPPSYNSWVDESETVDLTES